MDLTLITNSKIVQQTDASQSSHHPEDGNKMTPPFAQSRQDQDLKSCSPNMAQVLILPLLSSDSCDDIDVMCDTPKSYDEDTPDEWSTSNAVVPGYGGICEVPRSASTLEDETTTQKDPELSRFSARESKDSMSRDGIIAEELQISVSNSTTKQRPQLNSSVIDRTGAALVEPASLETERMQTKDVKGNCDGEPSRIVPERDHFGPSNLLSQFMGMRGSTRRLMNPTYGPANSRASSSPKSRMKRIQGHIASNAGRRSEVDVDVCPTKRLAAISPDVSPPDTPGSCLISLQLGHSVIRHMEEIWPAHHLLDRDYSSHISLTNAQRHDGSILSSTVHLQASEVDISLTAEDGIVVATLLQIRQKPLPGSTMMTTIRQRILNLSEKYRRLTIFVFESAGAGEYMSELSPKDVEIYTEFVCFTSSLKTSITVHLIPGGDETLSRWILCLMVQYAPQLIELDEITRFGDTTWELFFRQAGFNVRAAQVLSHSLFEEFGTRGLTAFLTMNPAERMLKYGGKLGIERQLMRCTRVVENAEPRQFQGQPLSLIENRNVS